MLFFLLSSFAMFILCNEYVLEVSKQGKPFLKGENRNYLVSINMLSCFNKNTKGVTKYFEMFNM